MVEDGTFLEGFIKFGRPTDKNVVELPRVSTTDEILTLLVERSDFLTEEERELFIAAKTYCEKDWEGIREGCEYKLKSGQAPLFNRVIREAERYYPGFMAILKKCLKQAEQMKRQAGQHLRAKLS